MTDEQKRGEAAPDERQEHKALQRAEADDARHDVLEGADTADATPEGRTGKNDGIDEEGREALGAEDPAPKKRGELNAELGRRGEDAAARFLYRHGYDIIERNWTCAAGEADIIARDGDWVVFVEVKTRTSLEKGFPSEAVNARKRQKYEKIAALFLSQYDAVDVPVRFDVVSLLVVGEDRAMLRHHINAFAAG